MQSLQRSGAVAALIMAATWVVLFAVFLGVLIPAGYFDEGIDSVAKVAILADNQTGASTGYLLYVVWAPFHVVLSLALYDRLKAGAPAMAQTATAIGLIWAGLIMASGMVATVGIRVVVDLSGTDPAQAGAVWAAIEAVVSGLGGEAGEVAGGLWLLLISWAALRARELPRPLSYLGLVLGAAGLITVVPPLEPAVFVYAVGFIAWWVWLGIVMLRSGDRGEAEPRIRAEAAAAH